jgi:hypothetical protein
MNEDLRLPINVIPAKAGIQKLLTLLGSRLCRSDESEINRSSLKF